MASLLPMTVSLTSCGGGAEKNYTIPDEVCGVSIDPDLLEPLLPPGDTFSAEPWSILPSCEFTVDSEEQGSMQVSADDTPWDPVGDALSARGLDADQVYPWNVEDGGAIWLADNLSGANIAFPCPYDDPNRPYGQFVLEIGHGGQIEDEDERAERIKEFALNYLEGIKQDICDG